MVALLNIALFSAWNNLSLVHQPTGKLVSFVTYSSFLLGLSTGVGVVVAFVLFSPACPLDIHSLHVDFPAPPGPELRPARRSLRRIIV